MKMRTITCFGERYITGLNLVQRTKHVAVLEV